jgi:hypothetical protein
MANSGRLDLSGAERMNTRMLATATGLVGVALGMAQPARAVTISKPMLMDPSAACQLSLPTTDTAVRPRATGFRNEGANAFVICGTTYFSNSVNIATELRVQMVAFDGGTHANVSCTAVNRQSGGGGEAFSTKMASVGPGGAEFSWAAADVNNFTGFVNSVTCTLPSGVAITAVRLVFPDDVGA